MKPIRVGVVGATGRMGVAVSSGLVQDPRFEIAFAVSRSCPGSAWRKVSGEAVPDLTLMGELGEAILGPGCQVLLDLSHRTICAENAELASQNKIAYVTGVTGIDSEGLDRIKVATESAKVAGYVIPNFAIGAVLMMVLSRTAARFMPDVEIIESHHEKKEDAPSGTALATAKIIAAARLNPPTVLPQPYLKVPGARGAVSDLVPIHSVRLPGLLAHQEVIFGAEGETLTIRHDSLSRNSFLGGVKMACSQALIRPEFLIGLDRLLFADS